MYSPEMRFLSKNSKDNALLKKYKFSNLSLVFTFSNNDTDNNFNREKFNLIFNYEKIHKNI